MTDSKRPVRRLRPIRDSVPALTHAVGAFAERDELCVSRSAVYRAL